MVIKIYTDGSSIGNPGPGGFCALVKVEGKTIIVKGGEDHTTNNRMEMAGVIAGLHYVHKHFPAEKTCAVFSDSSLVIESMKKGWKRKKNLDLWEKMDAIVAQFEAISWNWVRGHNGHPENTKADKVAFGEAKKRNNINTLKQSFAMRREIY